MTWEDLTRIEPRLTALLVAARAVSSKDQPRFCANKVWFRDFKPMLIGLAGWAAKDERLRTEEAYDLAYKTVYDALPDCRDCECA